MLQANLRKVVKVGLLFVLKRRNEPREITIMVDVYEKPTSLLLLSACFNPGKNIARETLTLKIQNA
jgi:hypothetical protein